MSSTSELPPAENRSRLRFESLPARIKDVIEDWLGSAIASFNDQVGGFSPGVAARLESVDGRRVFVKAGAPEVNADTPIFHRREALIANLLPPQAPVARLLSTYDEGPDGWILLIYEDVDGWTPRLPWRPDEVREVLSGIESLHAVLTPSPLSPEIVDTVANHFRKTLHGWRALGETAAHVLGSSTTLKPEELVRLEALAPEAVGGESLVHMDIRADNVILTNKGAVFVDWPHARVGAPFVDLLGLAPSMYLQGGPDLNALLSLTDLSLDEDNLNCVLAALAGYFIRSSLRPPPPGIPTIRQFQAAQGQALLSWLEDRLT